MPNGPVLVGLIVAVNPAEAETVRNTVLLNPFIPFTEIVDVPEDPAEMVRLCEFAVMVKSGPGNASTVIGTVTECDMVPLVPDIVAV